MVACGGWLSLDTAQVLCSLAFDLNAMVNGVQFGDCWLQPSQWRFEGITTIYILYCKSNQGCFTFYCLSFELVKAVDGICKRLESFFG